MNIERLFSPRGVAVVGSMSEGKLGYELVRQILEGGYKDLFAVNPKAQGAFSAPGFEAVSDIDQAVDAAVIVTPPHTVASVLEDCGRAGIRTAAIITAGFSESGNQEGETEIKRVAKKHGIRFIGPNCAGFLNTSRRFFPTLESRPPAGRVGLITQSGAIGGVFLGLAKEKGLGVSKFVNYGNAADLNEIDFLRYLAEDMETEVVALYIESVHDGREFMQAVRFCSQVKPLIVVKAGRMESGRRAALSHTGSLAGADAIYESGIRQSGGIRVRSIEEMFDVCKSFLFLHPPRGRRIVIVTNSGGPGVLAADRAEELGLEVPEPSVALKEALSSFLPRHCALGNPIDLTVEGTEEGYRETLRTVVQEYDMALALNITTPYLHSMPLARGICDAAEGTDKPIVASFLPRYLITDAAAYLEKRGVPAFATAERAVVALSKRADYRPGADVLLDLPGETKLLPGQGPLLEHEAMAWLKENGIPIPTFGFASEEESALNVCRGIGYPVVMKLVSPDVLHKSEVGGVVLGIQDDAMARKAFQKIRHAAAGKVFEGVVVYPFLQGAREVLLGLSRDPQFGPIVAFGLGGIYAEVWKDISIRVAPVDRAEAETMIREIKSLPILQGLRGGNPCDLDALADLIEAFSRLPFLFTEIDEIDLNPVFSFPEGLVVGDVRVIRRRDTSKKHKESTES